MKHIKNSLVVFASVLAITGVVTFSMPSLTKGQKSSDVPKNSFSLMTHERLISGPDPEGTSYAITSLTVSNAAGASTPALLRGLWGNTSDCFSFSDLGTQTFGPNIIVPAGETVHLAFPQPFVISAKEGAASCLRVEHNPTGVNVTVVGYRF